MFEKEAEEYVKAFTDRSHIWSNDKLMQLQLREAYKDGAELGCKKANEELEEKISVLLSCKNCPENKDGLICQKEYEIYDGGIKEMIDLNDLKRIALENAEKRQKNGANVTTDTRKMLKHCATEVIESAEAYTEYSGIKNLADDINATDIDEKWESQEEPDVCEEYCQKTKEHFSSELADIICCVLIIAGKEDIDIERAIYDCIEKNERRANGIGDKL